MIRTKHLVVFLAVIFVGIIVGAFLFASEGGKKYFADSTEPIFVETKENVTVSPEDSNQRDLFRQSLIAKLGTQSTDNEEEISVESTETVTDEREMGVPLGDGRISDHPEVGSIFSCQQSFQGGGVTVSGAWIGDGMWYPEEKVTVDDGATWVSNTAINLAEGARIITTNGLPNHMTGIYPISVQDDAYQYDKNPNQILANEQTIQLPQQPTLAVSPSCLPMGAIGVSLNGVALFSGLDAQGKDAVAHEVQDRCEGHPERSGQYHYHGESDCLVDSRYEGAESTLLGYALDGFGIFASLESGVEVTNTNLDVCHGHVHTIPWDGVLLSMYHYHMTEEYPYSMGCFMGTPVTSPVPQQTPPSSGMIMPSSS